MRLSAARLGFYSISHICFGIALGYVEIFAIGKGCVLVSQGLARTHLLADGRLMDR